MGAESINDGGGDVGGHGVLVLGGRGTREWADDCGGGDRGEEEGRGAGGEV